MSAQLVTIDFDTICSDNWVRICMLLGSSTSTLFECSFALAVCPSPTFPEISENWLRMGKVSSGIASLLPFSWHATFEPLSALYKVTPWSGGTGLFHFGKKKVFIWCLDEMDELSLFARDSLPYNEWLFKLAELKQWELTVSFAGFVAGSDWLVTGFLFFL